MNTKSLCLFLAVAAALTGAAAEELVVSSDTTLSANTSCSSIRFTDGVTEAMDGAERQYGEARLEKTVAANRDGLIVNDIRKDVTAFVAEAEPSDDITMLALDVKREDDA